MTPEQQKQFDEILSTLPELRRRFVLEYIKNGGNATQAAWDAGVSINVKDAKKRRGLCRGTLSRFMNDPKVKAALEFHKKSQLESATISADWWLQKNMKMVEYNMEIINVSRVGDKNREQMRDASAANSALERIGKHIGAYQADDQSRNTNSIFDLLKEIDGKTKGIPSA